MDFFNSDEDSRFHKIEGIRNNSYLDTTQLNLINYVIKSINDGNPLEIAGLDIHCTTTYYVFLEKELREILNIIGTNVGENKIWERYFQMNNILLKDEELFRKTISYSKYTQHNRKLIEILERNIKNPAIEEKQVKFLLQVLKNNSGYAKWIKTRPRDKGDRFNYILGREKYMADNALFLINEHYKNKKIIIFTSNYHITRNIQVKPGHKIMGQYIWEAFKDEVYTIPTIVFGGEIGYFAAINEKIKYRHPESLESIFHNQGYKYRFLDLKTLPKNYDAFLMYPSTSKLPQKYQWPNAYDGLIFINEARPNYLLQLTIEEMLELDSYFKKFQY